MGDSPASITDLLGIAIDEWMSRLLQYTTLLARTLHQTHFLTGCLQPSQVLMDGTSSIPGCTRCTSIDGLMTRTSQSTLCIEGPPEYGGAGLEIHGATDGIAHTFVITAGDVVREMARGGRQRSISAVLAASSPGYSHAALFC